MHGKKLQSYQVSHDTILKVEKVLEIALSEEMDKARASRSSF
jgi:hypothetical protein